MALPDPDQPPERGWYGLACWNALSEAQQQRMVTVGGLELGYTPGPGGTCWNGAEVAVETELDAVQGASPRFYCFSCAIAYLFERRRQKEGPSTWLDH
jgi:hypothetical protein